MDKSDLTYWLKPRRELLRKALLQFQSSGELSSCIDVDVALDTLYGPLHMLLMVQRNRLKQCYATQLAHIILRGIRNSSK